MPHRATLYSVRVHPRRKPDDLRPFGDFDESGTALKDAINGYFQAGGHQRQRGGHAHGRLREVGRRR